ncbi:MAG: restriction endonuclease [Alphaproteobacteria bacterium]|nr:restriction endonuclease [Alphaproteobacteria bacterium]MBV9694903.1 restriction endonuclease [Alphaproteobacteria bacterium]
MPNRSPVPPDIRERYYVQEWRHGLTILATVFQSEWLDILHALRAFKLLRSEILKPGGSKSDIAGKIDGALIARNWQEKSFDTKITVDGAPHPSPTHAVDCYKNRVALEVEWNNKDPFYDRDLNNFRLLFELRAIDVGVIVTRSTELQEIFNALGKGSSYGNSTTHFSKLLPRIEGGGGGGCPIVAFAIKKDCYVDDSV